MAYITPFPPLYGHWLPATPSRALYVRFYRFRSMDRMRYRSPRALPFPLTVPLFRTVLHAHAF